MGGIAYHRHMIGNGTRMAEGMADKMSGGAVKGPRAICTEGNRATVETADGKTRVPAADSTGITTTCRGRWTEIMRKVKRSLKLRISA